MSVPPGFFRPEAWQTLWRAREILAALAFAALGAWLLLQPGPFAQAVGAVVVAVGAGLALLALRRLRFKGSGAAPGVVQIDEGAIHYLGPHDGVSVALRDLVEVRLRTDFDKRRVWVLITRDTQLVSLPHDAAGAEALFDALAALPGLGSERLLAALRVGQPGTQIVWRDPEARALTALR